MSAAVTLQIKIVIQERKTMLSLATAFDLFLLSRETYCADTTIFNYKNTIRYFIDFMCMRKSKESNQIDVCDISKEDIAFYVLYLRKKKKNENNPIAPTSDDLITKRTVKTYCTDIRTFFNWLVREGYINRDESPMKNFKMIKPEVRSILPLTSDEVRILEDGYNALTELGCRNLAIIHLLLDEGFRVSEVRNLKLSDVHYNNDCIVVNGKGSKQRILPLARIVRKYLERYQYNYRPDTVHDFFFCDVNGNPITSDAVRNVFCRAKKRTKIERLHPHLLRHTFATSFIIGGGSLELLRIYMGHSDIATTQQYMHVVNAIQFSKNIYQLDSIFFKRMYY